MYAAAIVGIGVETILYAHGVGPQPAAVPVIPWLPAIAWVAYAFGAVWIVCGLGLLVNQTQRAAALVLGALLLACALILDVPRNVANAGSIALRTLVFEPIALAALAWLLPASPALPGALVVTSRLLFALSLAVFGVDHFLALGFIAGLIPGWIPWHAFWVAFFGVAFIAAGAGIAMNRLQRWAALGIGTMFAIWVLTLHLPRVLGLYAIPGAPRDPNEWSSLLIAIALWGGSWALAGGDRESVGA